MSESDVIATSMTFNYRATSRVIALRRRPSAACNTFSSGSFYGSSSSSPQPLTVESILQLPDVESYIAPIT